MSTPKRIQRKRTKGWRMPDGAVYVGRPTRWGNPFAVGEIAQHWHRATTHPYAFYIDRHMVVQSDQATRLFRRIVLEPSDHQFVGHKAPTANEISAELAGRDLACWCRIDQPCHADVLLEIANS